MSAPGISMTCHNCTVGGKIKLGYLKFNTQSLSELADQNNTVKSSSSGNNRKNILKNPSSLDFKIRTFLIDQSHVDIKLP
jgi:translation elongation factor EF-1alpha